jgi:superfamily II DNA/RNA helicase
MKEKAILTAIKDHLGIDRLNEIQQRVIETSSQKGDMIIYSPTGSGKTIAFIIPILKAMKDKSERLQTVIIAPSRELVTQIYGIVKSIAIGFKVTCCYGGHSVQDEKQSLSVAPSIIVATPGRLLDHIQRGNIDVYDARYLVLDEFDKSLELGFTDEMKKILHHIPNLSRRFLTSATTIHDMPDYVHLFHPITVNLLDTDSSPVSRMKIWSVESPSRDKLATLRDLLLTLPEGKSIVFANYRESVERIYNYLVEHNISAGIYHGALEQIEREKAVALFNNGSYDVMVTTDLGSRGLDIDNVQNIIHYHLPISEEVFTHRNGRTARVNNTGDVFVILAPEEQKPDYINVDENFEFPENIEKKAIEPAMTTLFFMAGKKEKISRGDIMGFIANNGGNISADEIGRIEIMDHYSLVAIKKEKAMNVLDEISKKKIKGQKVRVSIARIENRQAKDNLSNRRK